MKASEDQNTNVLLTVLAVKHSYSNTIVLTYLRRDVIVSRKIPKRWLNVPNLGDDTAKQIRSLVSTCSHQQSTVATSVNYNPAITRS